MKRPLGDKKVNPVTVQGSRHEGKDLAAGGHVITSERKREILHERALVLAGTGVHDESAEGLTEIIEFVLANEKYGIESAFVREVVPLKAMTRIPGLPEFMLGLTNVRGEIVPVIDIRRFFNRPGAGITDLDKLIILHYEDLEAGILADVIKGLRTLHQSEIQPPPATITVNYSGWMKGITKDQLIIIDTLKFLKSQIQDSGLS